MGKVLGIDPGVSETGWAVLEGEPGAEPRLLASGLIKTFPSQELPARLRRIHEECVRLIAEHAPESVALEQMFFLKAANTIRATLQARGVILLAVAQSGKPLGEYDPRTVKLALTGSGRAEKAQMQAVVQKALKLADILRPDDVADAAAIALCHLRSSRIKRLKVLDSFGGNARIAR